MEESADGLNQRIGRRVRALRVARGLSLEALAARSGVSRSMISVVERGESSPTAVVLEKLGVGLDVPLATLFDTPDATAGPVTRRADQPEWRDSASGYVRRNDLAEEHVVDPEGNDLCQPAFQADSAFLDEGSGDFIGRNRCQAGLGEFVDVFP